MLTGGSVMQWPTPRLSRRGQTNASDCCCGNWPIVSAGQREGPAGHRCRHIAIYGTDDRIRALLYFGEYLRDIETNQPNKKKIDAADDPNRDNHRCPSFYCIPAQ